MLLLERAIQLAVTAFAGKLDKSGLPQILHSLEVMLAAKVEYERDPVPGYTLEEFMTAAVLHDVAEDCPEYPLYYIRAAFGQKVYTIVKGVTRLTDENGKNLETYKEFIRRAASEVGSKRLKKVDVRINLSRIHTLPPEEQSISRRYTSALAVLEPLEEPQDLKSAHRNASDGDHEQSEAQGSNS
jgi:(p)ppGpp synthase/HD superfamily hydrolase